MIAIIVFQDILLIIQIINAQKISSALLAIPISVLALLTVLIDKNPESEADSHDEETEKNEEEV